MVVVQADLLSSTIIRDTIRDGLRTAAAAAGDPLKDPKSASRPGKSKFILTAHPDRDPFYPHVLVEEAGDRGGRIDRRVGLHQHRYDVRITILSESATDLYKIRDATRNWVEKSILTFANAGYQEVEIASSTAATWESDVKVQAWQMVLTGLVFTKGSP